MLSPGDALRVLALLGQTLDLPATIELKQDLLDPLSSLACHIFSYRHWCRGYERVREHIISASLRIHLLCDSERSATVSPHVLSDDSSYAGCEYVHEHELKLVAHLKVHQLRHSGEQPHRCIEPGCKYAATTAAPLPCLIPPRACSSVTSGSASSPTLSVYPVRTIALLRLDPPRGALPTMQVLRTLLVLPHTSV